MGMLKLIFSGIRKRKAYAISILILTFIISLALIMVGSVIVNGKNHYQSINENANSPDFANWMKIENYEETKKQEILDSKYVEDVEIINFLSVTKTKQKLNGHTVVNNINLEVYKPQEHAYELENLEKNTTPGKGEIFMPLIFKDLYDANVGDIYKIIIDDSVYEYVIADFYEHPYVSSSFTGLKYLLVNETDFKDLEALQTDKLETYVAMYTYYKEAFRGDKLNETQKQLNEDINIENYGEFAYSIQFFEQATLLMTDIISVILIAFIMLLFGIVLLVIDHAVKSSIEQDYRMFGVLKALGFSGKQVLHLVVLQYVLVAGVGIGFGVMVSALIANQIGNLLLSGTGLLYNGGINIMVTAMVVAFILGFIVLLVLFVARKIRRISPVQAITKGHAPIYFSSRLNISFTKMTWLPLSLRLALKSIITNLGQYFMILGISMLLVFSVTSVSSLNQHFSSDKISAIFGYYSSDIQIAYQIFDEETDQEIMNFINDRNEVTGTFTDSQEYVSLDGRSTVAETLNDFGELKISVLEGRWPKYKNEVTITKVVADSLDKKIGDKIQIESRVGVKEQFIITGYHQTVNEVGNHMYLTSEGMQMLDSSYQENRREVYLKDPSATKKIIKELEETYKDDKSIAFTDKKIQEKESMTVIVDSVQSVSVAIYVLTLILIAITILLVCSISIQKEKISIGIQRAQGFSVKQLRISFALRFTIISILGGLLGLLLNFLISEKMLASILYLAGITNYKVFYSVESMVFPILIIAVFTYLFSYVVTRKIRKVKIVDLINE